MKDNEAIVKRLFKLLCEYKPQPQALYDYLLAAMWGKYYPRREIIFEQGQIVKEALYVSDGYVTCQQYDRGGNRQVFGLYGKESIIAGQSFMSQKPSEFEWTVLPGTYLMGISYQHMEEVYDRFPDSQELARLIMAGITENEMKRLLLLKQDAETVVLDFYNRNPAFIPPGELMTDADVSSYLLIGESTLRRVRNKMSFGDHMSGTDIV